eukprot:TRINITY_DN1044_c0_g1_i1.p1 TRINITY_DN1044_c0_g1~~TRINITY_DN1044_c0_g1_i1.p1  ORF type:complete len:554 (+),score=178.30 TRINITY_DN1044_c0_g1_i1:330-1991(+)
MAETQTETAEVSPSANGDAEAKMEETLKNDMAEHDRENDEASKDKDAKGNIDDDLGNTDDAVVEREATEKGLGNESLVTTPKASGVQGSEKKTGRKRKNRGLPATPASERERPSRERKTVERFSDVSVEKQIPKELVIEQGKGTALKDIPNVVFKLSKRKGSDEVLKHLHVFLYGRRAKPFHIKSNILQFSGFVWRENEEKMRTRLKEKLEKYNKDVLYNVCDILDVRNVKGTSKKEEIVHELIEFLESPHVTTEIRLEDKAQALKDKKKRKRGKEARGKGRSSGKASRKRRKTDTKKNKNEADHKEEERGAEEEAEAEATEKGVVSYNAEEEDAVESEREEDDDDYDTKKRSKRSSKRGPKKRKTADSSKNKSKGAVVSPQKSLKSPTKAKLLKDDASAEESAQPSNSPSSKVFSRKGKRVATESEKSPPEAKKQGRKKTSTPVNKSNSKEKGTDSKDSDSKGFPSDDEVRGEIRNILKQVDFNTATFTDILKRLAVHFECDFSEIKARIKSMIQEELSNLAEGDDDEDQSGDGNGEQAGSEEIAGQVVEAE